MRTGTHAGRHRLLRHAYKILAVILLLYSLIWGMLNDEPRLDILNETIRNVYYHVPIWFAMLFMMGVSLVFSISHLATASARADIRARNAALIGLFLSIPGLITGSIWARYTWGTWWTFQDPKLNGVDCDEGKDTLTVRGRPGGKGYGNARFTNAARTTKGNDIRFAVDEFL